MDQPILTPSWPMLFDLASDPGELYNLMETKLDMGWMVGVALKVVGGYEESIAQYPKHQDRRRVRGLLVRGRTLNVAASPVDQP